MVGSNDLPSPINSCGLTLVTGLVRGPEVTVVVSPAFCQGDDVVRCVSPRPTAQVADASVALDDALDCAPPGPTASAVSSALPRRALVPFAPSSRRSKVGTAGVGAG